MHFQHQHCDMEDLAEIITVKYRTECICWTGPGESWNANIVCAADTWHCTASLCHYVLIITVTQLPVAIS